MKKMILLFSLIYGIDVHAQSKDRDTQLNLSFSSGADQYQAQNIDSSLGINSEWQLLGSYFRSDSGVADNTNEKLISTEGRIGIDWAFHRSWSTYIELIGRQDPYELIGRGVGLGFSTNISDLWQGERLTRLSVSIQNINYEQNLTIDGTYVDLEVQRTVSQKVATLIFEQEILDWLEIGASYSRYNYSGESDQLALVTSRRRSSIGSNGPTYGLPDRSFSLSTTIYPLEWMETTFTGGRTKLLPEGEAESRSLSFNHNFLWKAWSLGLDFSSVTFTGDVSENDEDTQQFLGGSMGYRW